MATFDGSHEEISSLKTSSSIPLPDMSHEYTCFLCNGYQTVIGSIMVDSVGVILLNAVGMTLEMNTFDQLVSVNETEPVSTHILIIVFPQRYVVLSHIIRKNKLVQVFKDVGLYKEEPKLPLEAIGFYDPEVINDHNHTVDASGSLHLTTGGNPHERLLIQFHSHHGDDELPLPPSANQWSNEQEQERHVQKEIRQQSLLNPIQLLSSQDQARKSTINSGDWMQLEKYPSTTTPTLQQHEHTRTGHSTVHHTNSGTHTTVRPSCAALQQLVGVFPNHSHEQLHSALVRCGHNTEDAITLILNLDEGQT